MDKALWQWANFIDLEQKILEQNPLQIAYLSEESRTTLKQFKEGTNSYKWLPVCTKSIFIMALKLFKNAQQYKSFKSDLKRY